jgi:hypothetical protein
MASSLPVGNAFEPEVFATGILIPPGSVALVSVGLDPPPVLPVPVPLALDPSSVFPVPVPLVLDPPPVLPTLVVGLFSCLPFRPHADGG